MDMQIKKAETVHQQSFEILRGMIINGMLSPGTKLIEEKLAAQLGVSRTPIREAIKRLEQEGLLREKTVIEPTEQDLRNSYEIRMLLEGYSARCAALTFTEEDKQALLSIIEQSKSDQFEVAVQSNTAFHDMIIRASGNQQMIDVLEKMRSFILLCRHTITKKRACLHDEHEEIYQAIVSGDADLAERLVKEHLKHNMNECIIGLQAKLLKRDAEQIG